MSDRLVPRDEIHPDLPALAAFEAGELPADAAARTAAHTAGCPRCAESRRQLAGIRRALRDLPRPAVPADVAARLQASLAAAGEGEQRSNGTGAGARPRRAVPGGGAAGRRDEGGPRRAAADRWWARPRTVAVAAAAAVALLLGGAAVVGNRLTEQGGPATQAASGPAGAHATALPVIGRPSVAVSGTDYAAGTLAGAARLAAPVAPAAHRGGSSAAESAPAPQPSGSPGASAQPMSGSAASPAPELDRLFTQPAALAACVAAIAPDASTTALAVDFARFGGLPAAVIVLAQPGGSTVEIWAVGPDCRAGEPDIRSFATAPMPR